MEKTRPKCQISNNKYNMLPENGEGEGVRAPPPPSSFPSPHRSLFAPTLPTTRVVYVLHSYMYILIVAIIVIYTSTTVDRQALNPTESKNNKIESQHSSKLLLIRPVESIVKASNPFELLLYSYGLLNQSSKPQIHSNYYDLFQ